MNIEKKIWVTLTLLIIVLIPTSFAYWYWNSTTNTNVSFTINGLDITYVGGNDISGVNLIPVSSKEKGIADNTAIEKVVTASSNSTTYMNLYLTLETLPDGLKDKSFVYEVYNGANLVGKGNFASYNQGEKAQIASAQKITSSTTSFQIYIWIDGNVDNPSSMMNQNFKFVLSADASEQDPAEQTLTKLGVTVNNNEVTTFGKIPYATEDELIIFCENQGYENVSTCLSLSGASTYEQILASGFMSVVDDNGVFAAFDNLGTSYYYRGNVENNYIYFANLYWRIIRINGDGTIRIIYDGSEKKRNGEVNEDNKVLKTAYTEGSGDNAYVGYMYGSINSNYENTHKNINSSIVKELNDKWYKDTIIAGGYDKYVADAIYCNDRKVTTGTFWNKNYIGTGIGLEESLYATSTRLSISTPSLICEQSNDKFSITDIGNGDLTYPIGLITADEAIMAGCTITNNSRIIPSFSSYLFSTDFSWTMSPFAGPVVWVWQLGYGSISFLDPADFIDVGLRPVISLKADIPLTGNGSYETPFIVQ